MKSRISYALAVGAVCSVPAYGALVNVDFNARGPSATMVGAGVLGSAGDTWNGFLWTGGGVTSATGLLDASGTASTVGVAISTGWTDVTGDTPGPAATDAVDLMRDGLLHASSATPGTATITLSGLPTSSAYTLVLFAAGDGASHGSILTVPGGVNAGTGTDTATTTGSSASPLAEPQHYVAFTGTTSAGGEVSFDWTGLPFQWSALNGLQVDVVPEPSSALLLGLAGLGLLRRRRS